LLAGRDFTETGVLEVQAGERVAVAISRGGAPKLYDYTDPNEDATLCAEGPGGQLIAVADGHWGHDGARAALERLASTGGEDWLTSQTRDPDEWRRVIFQGVQEAHEAVLRTHGEERRPRTTLALALTRPREGWIFAASVGDSHVFRVDAKGAVDLGWPRRSRSRFLGHRDADAEWVERATRIATSALRDAWGIAAVTDGISEPGIGLDEPEAAVERAFTEARAQRTGAFGAAEGIAEAANAAQRRNAAGDNVGVAVAWLGER